jgi:hypothetical protein
MIVMCPKYIQEGSNPSIVSHEPVRTFMPYPHKVPPPCPHHMYKGCMITIYKRRASLPNRMEIEGLSRDYHMMYHIFWWPTSRTPDSTSLKLTPAGPEIEPIRLSGSTWPSERPTWLSRYASSSLPMDDCQQMTSFRTRWSSQTFPDI